MAHRTLSLPLTIADEKFDAHLCARCIESRLNHRPGIKQASVTFSPSADHPRGQAVINLDYDPDLLSLAEIDRDIRATGACMDGPILRLVIPVRGIVSTRHERAIEDSLSNLPGVSASASYASGSLRVEFSRDVCPVTDVIARLHSLGLRLPDDWQPPCEGVAIESKSAPTLAQTVSPSRAPAQQLDIASSPSVTSARLQAGSPSDAIAPRASSPEPTPSLTPTPSAAEVPPQPGWHTALREPDVLLALGAGLFLLMGFTAHATQAPSWLRLSLLSASFLCGGWYPILDLIQTLRHPRLNIDVMMLAAAIGAALLEHYEEGALLLFLFSLGGAGERLAMDRARNAIKALSQLAPDTACLIDAQGRELQVKVEDLRVGDQVLVRPGQRVAADGVIVVGASSLNQSPISGESVPVDKTVGDEVFAGTLNGPGLLRVRVSKPAGETTIAKISRLVEEAQTNKSPTEAMTQRVEAWYVPLVLGVTALLVVVPPLMGFPTKRADSLWAGWFYQAMAFLTAASPCALAIGTPAAILSGIARAAWAGVLIKGGGQLESLGKVSVIAFDKTGTLTTGKPRVTDVSPVSEDTTTQRLLTIAASIEAGSDHPLAQAVVASARETGVTPLPVTDVSQTPGMGIKGKLEGVDVSAGRLTMFPSTSPRYAEASKIADTLESQGKTTITIGFGPGLLGLIALADQPRPTAAAMIKRIKALGIKRTIMLTGDNQRTAAAVATQTGIDEFYAALLPEDKLNRIESLIKTYGKVAMVGDGVNDAPALATASVGIAISGASRTGSDVALETADVVLLSDDLVKLPQAIGISRFTGHIILQNLIIALGVIAVLAPLAALGHTTIGIAVLFHEGSTVLVVLNALRILRYRTA